ncbi:Multidrug resistance protein MdtN [Vibrio alginolyticus]|uniref:Multidrug resistance protein MdtN n=2 Tax=Vibrio alginolyticus TaxID=663 RepID=A0A1W6V0M2_VIBAL|nr:multidrug transporter subunit MdtN [Vibrio alginolyticus]ARO98784.1 Multidrug resistance protein MdtN [Vibrio alginolyticus]ARP03501.1 Multidrug resistance protein MdtN [Vibrio alginolyticus]ARP08559.1 Multidrug resistance protein MdtN [Vibrio alginolyticus]ARP13634.1 Multidrug resistance protein MdtN [Vibrio alginolyticus]ARP18694.1 Multidrug resistance protein MdtN [Vibrio alginolyticus]
MAKSVYTRRYSAVGIMLAIAITVGAALSGWYYQHRSNSTPLSDDAVLTANAVNIAPAVAGRITSILVKDNQRIKKGDLLFLLDPAPYEVVVDKAKAELQLAEALRDAQRRVIVAEQSNTAIASEQVARAKTNLSLTEAALARLKPLGPKGYVTAQQIDDARTARDDARTSLEQAMHQKAAAEALVTTLDESEAVVKARKAALDIAEYELAETKVYAPTDGLVVGLTTSAGEVVAPGESLFTLIDTRNWYASATFPETELEHIAIGDCSKVYVLANRSKPISGRVESIGWGVISEDLINLPRNLPYVPKSLNWVRIAQRFPVQIKLDNPPNSLMRVGASAVVLIQHGEQCDNAEK